MKRIKIILICIASIMCGILLGACGDTVIAEQTYPIKIWKQNENGSMTTYVVEDEDTGVNYIVISKQPYSGCDGCSIAMYPRYKADGNLYVNK